MQTIKNVFTRWLFKDREIAELKARIKQLEKELIRERGLKDSYKILAGRA